MKKGVAKILSVFTMSGFCLSLVCCAAVPQQKETATTYAMSTLVTQTAYGENALAAMDEVERELTAFEQRLSLFGDEGDVAQINAAAGREWVEVSPETLQLLQKSVDLSLESEGAFAITIAPLTLAWGITSDTPRVPAPEEIEQLLGLVDDSKLELSADGAYLPEAGMAIDLGGIAKGEACSVAKRIYTKNQVDSALLDIGGNVYARGEKPDGSPWVVGFRDPDGTSGGYIASFPLRDEVIAVSGGYERFFEADGTRYIHILDPRTGYPAESDIVSVGVIHEDGATADYYSTRLFVQGRDRALDFMRAGGCVILLDNTDTLYISASLEEDFEFYEEAAKRYELVVVAEEGG